MTWQWGRGAGMMHDSRLPPGWPVEPSTCDTATHECLARHNSTIAHQARRCCLFCCCCCHCMCAMHAHVHVCCVRFCIHCPLIAHTEVLFKDGGLNISILIIILQQQQHQEQGSNSSSGSTETITQGLQEASAQANSISPVCDRPSAHISRCRA